MAGAVSFLDRTSFTASAGGTGSFTVAGASTGYLTPAQAGATNGTLYRYVAQSADMSQWEIGTGTYSTSGPSLTRTTVLFSSNSGSVVNFTVAPTVFIDVLAEDLLVTNKINICKYGGKGDGVTDNLSAWNAAVAALGSQGGRIYFPTGVYYFSAQPTYTYPSSLFKLALEGDGEDCTELYFPSTDGPAIYHNGPSAAICPQSTSVFDLSITTGRQSGGVGFTLGNVGANNGNAAAQNTINRVTFRGHDGYSAADYWTIALDITGVSNVTCDTVMVQGAATTVLGYISNGTSGVAGTILTVTAYGGRSLVVGDVLGNAAVGGVNSYALVPGTSISSFGTGSGGTGTYNLSQSQVVGTSGAPATIAVGSSGIGLYYAGQSSTGWATVLNLKACTFNSLAIGFDIGPWVQGVTVSAGCNFNGCTTSVYVPARTLGTLGTNPFTTTNSSTTVKVTSPGHGCNVADCVTFSNATTFNNVTVNGAYFVTGVVDSDHFNIVVTTTANATGSGGGSIVGYYYGNPGIAQVSVIGCQFGQFQINSAGIVTMSAVNGLFAVGNTFTLNYSYTTGINLVMTYNGAIQGNIIIASTGGAAGIEGIQVVANVASCGVAVGGNVLAQPSTGIALQSGSCNVNAGYGNCFLQNGTAIANAGSNNTVSGGNSVH